ncbi:MAG: hypothetical protein J6V53_00475 [Alphaproteobacteria bacterium]|nr:hypothetical protein [Alphaproteobacteria bacterium]
MKKFLINILFLLVAVLSGVGLFTLKYQVKEKETELKRIHANILKTKRDLHMLEAEWAHLNDPKRLKAIVTNQTDWKVIKAEQLVRVDDLPIKLEEPEEKTTQGKETE